MAAKPFNVQKPLIALNKWRALTHWSLVKMVALLRNLFVCVKIIASWFRFIGLCFQAYNIKYLSIGMINDLSHKRKQSIT